MIRLNPSVRAFVMPLVSATRTAGHQRSIVPASRVASGRCASVSVSSSAGIFDGSVWASSIRKRSLTAYAACTCFVGSLTPLKPSHSRSHCLAERCSAPVCSIRRFHPHRVGGDTVSSVLSVRAGVLSDSRRVVPSTSCLDGDHGPYQLLFASRSATAGLAATSRIRRFVIGCSGGEQDGLIGVPRLAPGPHGLGIVLRSVDGCHRWTAEGFVGWRSSSALSFATRRRVSSSSSNSAVRKFFTMSSTNAAGTSQAPSAMTLASSCSTAW